MIDFDKVYEPEQLDQLAKDLVKARKEKLDIFEKPSLARWKRDGISARIRKMWDGRLTCWPAEMDDKPRTKGRGGPVVHKTNMDFPHYQLTVALRFDQPDLPLLRAAARTDTKKRREERSIFDEAADSIERGSYLVTQVMSADELQKIVGRFAQAGVSHVTIDTLRVGDTKPARV